VLPHHCDELELTLEAFLPDLREPGGDDTERQSATPKSRLRGGQHVLAR
jgi:hypothetical protein